jgi:ribosome-associated toxin RatA of RatAB toxin-antitoxin module
MPTFGHTLLIRAAPDALFALSQDYDRRLQWDPFLREARLLGGAGAAAVGVRSWCVARGGLGMETEYITFQPPQLIAVRMTRGPAIVRTFAGSWRFTEVAPDLTRVSFRYHLESRTAWLRPLLDPPLVAILRRETRARLEALKRAAETTSILDAYRQRGDTEDGDERPGGADVERGAGALSSQE